MIRRIFAVFFLLIGAAVSAASAPGLPRLQTPQPAALVQFLRGDEPLCSSQAEPVATSVRVSLPEGMASAVLESSWRIIHPPDLTALPTVTRQTVRSGQLVQIHGRWPGIRQGDALVETRLGAVLLGIDGGNISPRAEKEYYWYPWTCRERSIPVSGGEQPPLPTPPFSARVISTPVQTTAEPPVETGAVEFLPAEAAQCAREPGRVEIKARIHLPPGAPGALLRVTYRLEAPTGTGAVQLFQEIPAAGGDEVLLTAPWPGVRPGDALVEGSFRAVLVTEPDGAALSPETRARRYWLPFLCPFSTE